MLSAKRIFSAGHLPAGLNPVRLIPGVNMLITALLAYSLAQLTWMLFAGVDDAVLPSLPPVIPAGVAPAAAGGAGLGEVAALHLLGDSERPPVVESPPISAPETRLNLTLRGVVALNAQEAALAIIAQGSGNERQYRVGETVPGGAVLYEIHADRVILQRGGRFETLTLPREEKLATSPPGSRGQPARSVAGVIQPAADTRQLNALRETLITNPQEALQLITAQPVMDGGQLKGYRVTPGRDRALFRNVGLRPGDVVTSVNGIPLNDLSQMGQVFAQLRSARQLDVLLERAGRQTQLTLSLD